MTLSNYLASRVIREAVEGYPQPFDSAAIDAEVRAEIVVQENSSTDTLNDNCALDGLLELE